MYLIKFKTTVQVSPDDFDIISVEKLFQETATIKEIKEWVRSKSNAIHPDKFRLLKLIYLSQKFNPQPL